MIAKMPSDKGTRTTLKGGTSSNNSKGSSLMSNVSLITQFLID
jgi:hypothetical protein